MNEELQARVDSLRSEYEDLLESVAMTDVTDDLGLTATKISGLPGKIKEVRDAGYVYANFLENKAETLDKQWRDVRSQIQQAIRNELATAQNDVEELDDLWDQLERAIAGDDAPTVKKSGGGLGSMLKAAAESADDDSGLVAQAVH